MQDGDHSHHQRRWQPFATASGCGRRCRPNKLHLSKSRVTLPAQEPAQVKKLHDKGARSNPPPTKKGATGTALFRKEAVRAVGKLKSEQQAVRGKSRGSGVRHLGN